MPRTARLSVGGICYHVINRGNAGMRVFAAERDYREFVALLAAANERLPMRLLAYCLMPNHFHLVAWPRGDGDLSRWMQWLLTSHVRRHHRRHGTDGHVWQGRFKGFPIQVDGHLLTVLRYVERNPLRANVVGKADDWCSAKVGLARTKDGVAGGEAWFGQPGTGRGGRRDLAERRDAAAVSSSGRAAAPLSPAPAPRRK